MKENVGALVKTRKKFRLDLIPTEIIGMQNALDSKENGIIYWKSSFREGVRRYKIMTKACNAEAYSNFETEFLKLVKKYSEMTGEKDIAELTPEEIKARNGKEYKIRIAYEQF